MAIERDDLLTILEVLRERPSRQRLLILGDAVVHFLPPELGRVARQAEFPLAIVPERLDPVTLGTALGFERTDTLDVNGHASLTIDLHETPPPELHDAFDCIIDAGVLYWCSDPGAALRSILTMMRVGGIVAHISAVSGFYGRGYYNVHPLLLEDFYLANGCEFVLATYRPRARRRGVSGYLARAARRENAVSRSESPGRVYLQDSTRHRISFGPRYREPAEAALIPNNVLGVFIFAKRQAQSIRMPLRSTAYEEAKGAK